MGVFVSKLMGALGACVVLFGAALANDLKDTDRLAKISTSMGDIVVALDPVAAPKTVENFFAYANAGHFDRVIFHRVLTGRVIQSGGYSRLNTARATRAPIAYEGDNGLKNVAGAIAMARYNYQPDSATSQWFINIVDNPELDQRETDLGVIHGYTVFGRVVLGFEVAKKISMVPTGAVGPFSQDAPLEQVLVNRVDEIDVAALEALSP